ncbi:lanthionine synthetase C family protein [Actinomadura montaniterrae]|uniref:lanthionine synthetase C family protein n=1 Tax=Actinomadura montaniterrae TaxID=1803903 RepID=UPI001CEFAB73|nr:lanthionine synthetase C family protein [Actinomadura montaniterrae]
MSRLQQEALQDAVLSVADLISERLDSPEAVRGRVPQRQWWPQSLAHGAAGVALLHIERARAGRASWRAADDWLSCVARDGVSAGPDSHLHYGVPALAFALQTAGDRYARTLEVLDQQVVQQTLRRLKASRARLDQRERPALAEFDAIRGLSGFGNYLLQRKSHTDLLCDVLRYLVQLTEPVDEAGEILPGWWTDSGPGGRPSGNFPGGHANTGMAHGIAGPLALLSLAMRDGVVVDGQDEAISRICAWLDRWRQDGDFGPWWPYWITRPQLRGESPVVAQPSRPSWCYGIAGVARAQQLAAIATGDLARQQMAENALVGALADPRQQEMTTDLSLCHGYAGLALVATRCAGDAVTSGLDDHLPQLIEAIVPDGTRTADAQANGLLTSDFGLLEGAAGVALALYALHSGPPASGWDSCLLIA